MIAQSMRKASSHIAEDLKKSALIQRIELLERQVEELQQALKPRSTTASKKT